jgi:acetolactate synthase regulatory subunit
MNPHSLPLTFAVGKPQTLDALEAVLAIARRGNCQLASLQLRDGGGANRVALELLAPDPDLLDLFLTRLHNLFDITDIAVAATSAAPTCAIIKLQQA